MWPQRVQYAVRALIALAVRPSVRTSAGEIARQYDIPQKYLEAILLDLKQAGLIDSTKGKSGGYQLVREPSAVRMVTVITALEPDWFSGSPTAAGVPVQGSPPEQPVLTALNECIRRELENITLADALTRWQDAAGALNYVI
jgi:Rrf2 family transcriptional regulator, cysteine metabolism repressor